MKPKIAFAVAAVMSTAMIIGFADTHAADVVATGGQPGDTTVYPLLSLSAFQCDMHAVR